MFSALIKGLPVNLTVHVQEQSPEKAEEPTAAAHVDSTKNDRVADTKWPTKKDPEFQI